MGVFVFFENWNQLFHFSLVYSEIMRNGIVYNFKSWWPWLELWEVSFTARSKQHLSSAGLGPTGAGGYASWCHSEVMDGLWFQNDLQQMRPLYLTVPCLTQVSIYEMSGWKPRNDSITKWCARESIQPLTALGYVSIIRWPTCPRLPWSFLG